MKEKELCLRLSDIKSQKDMETYFISVVEEFNCPFKDQRWHTCLVMNCDIRRQTYLRMPFMACPIKW